MKKTAVLTIAVLVALLLASAYAFAPVKASPRSDVDIKFYGSHEAAYAALVAGDVDFIQWSLTYEQRLAVEDDPDLAVAGYCENGMMEFDLNNNYTVPMTYPGVRNPLNDMHFRRALSCAVDKNYIVDTILMGAAGVLNVPIPLNSMDWWPDCALPGAYEWSYNMTKAEEELALAGFVDTDDDGIRNYPSGWPGAEDGRNMDPLILCIRTEDKRYDAGQYLAGQLDLLGIPYTKIEGTSDVLFPQVMGDRNYHIYTGGWSLGRYPTFLYSGFHSDFYYPYGPNYVTGMNASNLPNYPDYDELARQVYYTDSLESAKAAAKEAAALGWCHYVFNIPLWSYKSYVGWRKTMAGVINEFGYGYDNAYQFMNAYNTLGGPIRMGTISAPKALNPIYSQWYYDYAVLDRVFTSLMNVNPYDLSIDQPGAAQDWEVSTWVDPDPGPGEPSEKTLLTYYLRKDIGMVDPSGTPVRNFTAYDVEFSCWYTYSFDDGWNWADYQDVHHTEVVDDYTIKFYFDDASYWFYTSPQYPLFPTELLDTLCGTSSVSFTIAGNGTAGTHFKLPTSDQIVKIESEDIPVDFYIYGGYEDYEHNWIMLEEDCPDGTYTITYWTPDVDPHGYYLAGLDWTDTWYSIGPFYAIEIVPGVGGYAKFNRNPVYWWETPPLGETDWRWVWDTPGHAPGWTVPGPDGGYFEISIYDVVKATASYCHYGTGPYDPVYFPGADLDSSDLGHVGIYDVVSITGKYGMTWGSPPP
ncbi:hypothetical protein CW667_03170 [Candidatus Bathyarchaeota archaeon]|nr:MAG: hypothetical protein CW667_03170 [Candidatus Bathyarchaeota archaeon]RLI18412.1 MAG: hypothetical protein DRO44_01210 [Candidatus Bathyarchaeota archaeon]